MSPTIAAAIAVTLGSAVQSATGIGFGVVSAPFLIALMGPREGVRTSIMLSIFVNILVIAREPRHVKVKSAAYIAIPAVIATVLLAVPIRRMDVSTLSIAAGVSIILAVIALLTGLRLPWLKGIGGGIITGIVTAAMNLTSGVFSPPAAIYAVNSGWSQKSMRPTLQACFICLNIAAMASIGIPSFNPWLPACLGLGWLLGGGLAKLMDEKFLIRAVLVLAFAGGVIAIVRGLS